MAIHAFHKVIQPDWPGNAEARSQEIKRRMRTRFTWIVGILVLVSIGLLMACSGKYTPHFDGLVVVSTYTGDAVMETFSLDLGNGEMTQVNNADGPPTPGAATAVVLNPAGTFAYVIVTQNSAITPSSTGITAYPVQSDGKLAAGAVTALNPTSPTVNAPCVPPSGPTTYVSTGVQPTPVVPSALAIDSAGKYLFVADTVTSGQTLPYNCNGSMTTSTVQVPGTVSVFAVNGSSLTEVTGSPFALPIQPGGQPADATALAVTPTAFPVLNAPCSAHVPPTSEDLYVTDYHNNLVFNYQVTSTGALSLVQTGGSTQGVPTGTEPNGVAVDPCNRFVYVGNSVGSVSAYTICSVVSLPECPNADYSLLPVAGSPYNSGNGAGPLTVDAYAHFLYVLATNSNAVYGYKISSTNGALTPLTPAFVATNSFPTSIAIRSDDSFMFVANFNSANLSEYGITPFTGALTPQPTVTAFPLPWGVAVK